ncbi:MAG: glycoside hydrolase family 31 protein [Bacteroidales bacterium]
MKPCLTKLISFTVVLTVWSLVSCLSAKVISYDKTDGKVVFRLDKGLLEISILSENSVRVRSTILPEFPSKKSLVVLQSPPPVRFNIKEKGKEIIISTSAISVRVERATGVVRFTDLKGTTILSEDVQDGRVMKAAVVAGLNVYNCTTRFLSPSDEALYGLGCHPEDTLSINYKGRDQDLVIKYMTGAIPVLISNKGYGLMWDNYSPSYFRGSVENNTKYSYMSESGEMIDYYFFHGPEPDKIISEYRKLTGPAPMFPKWAFGLFQSQDRYKSQAEVLSVKDNYRNNRIPVDCIVQDWFYWEPDVIGSHRFWPERYPDPALMVKELHDANFHTMISIWPVMAKGTANYKAMEKAGNLTSILWDNVMTHTFDNYYDAHSQKARLMYWQQARDSLIAKQGWDAWWVDQCEPDNGTLLDERRKADFETGKGIDYFNTYSLMHSQGLYENWRKDIQGKRAFFLIRQAFAGQQRNAATLWSSDITCTWRAFKSQVPQGINSCASGIPYWTSDIGGYHFHWMPPDWSTPDNRELFTRWFQFGTFSPIFRIHGKGERALFSSNWDQKTKDILLEYDNLRYRLMPYLYSLGWKVTTDGYTILRSLVFDFRTDPEINNIPDEYMFGPAFLVCPVTERMYSNSKTPDVIKSRKVYLPARAGWYDFWSGEKTSGGKWLDVPVPVGKIPVYVRAGSIVPMGPYLQYATEKAADPVELRIYPGADCSFTLYEDENDNYNYEKGLFATITFRWDDKARKLTIGERKGTFPGMLTSRTFNIVLAFGKRATGIETEPDPDQKVSYNGLETIVKF